MAALTTIRRCAGVQDTSLAVRAARAALLFPSHARVMNNAALAAKPWEPSCIEVGATDVRFYFETGDDQGLEGFRALAANVADGSLPGRTENHMREGFAVWVVARTDYLQLLAAKPALPE